jgi:hypothetical protein
VNAQFGPRKNLSKTSWYPSCVKSYDIDGDGDMDVLTSSESDDKIAWYENLGGGLFGGEHIVNTPDIDGSHVLGDNGDLDSPGTIFAADLDNDGDLDVISASKFNSKVVWYKNLGGGNFGPQMVISTSVNFVVSVYASDIDNDGNMDILSASQNDDKIAWYKNLGGGIFSSQNIISTSADHATSVISLDVDTDGDLDVISTSTYGTNRIGWFENLGNGTFDTLINVISITMNTFSMKTSDIDNDGDSDLVVGAYQYFGLDRIIWFENLGGGIFSSEKIISNSVNGYSYVSTIDVDNDGDIDVVTGENGNGEISWYENNGAGVFGTQHTISYNGHNVVSVFATDIDGDGNNDVLSASNWSGLNFFDKVSWYKNLGGGLFGNEQIITPDADGLRNADAVDIDNDGDLDAVFSSSTGGVNPINKVGWYENLGNGNFSSLHLISIPNFMASSIVSADLDNDNDIDIAYTMAGVDSIVWCENLGSGNFGPQMTISADADGPISIYSSDIDGDGDMDVISASVIDNRIAWYENLGSGSFGPMQVISSSVNYPNFVYASDIDGDGDEDVLSVSQIDNKVAWYKNLGGGVFGPQIIISTNVNSPIELYTADLDNDGLIDVLSASTGDDKLAWYKNLGGGVFGSQIIISIATNGGLSVKTIDIDNDGDQDVFSTSSLNEIFWYENNGIGSFGPENIVTTMASDPISVSSADFDNDGALDILTASYGDDKLSWYRSYFNNNYKLKGELFYDANQNALKDSNELGLSFLKTELQPNGITNFSGVDGSYFFAVDTGIYTLTYIPSPFWNLTTDSVSFIRELTGGMPIVDSLNFGFYPDSIFTNIQPVLTGGFPRCNDTTTYWLNIQNQGTTLPSGIIHLQLHDSVNYVTAAIAPDSIIGQNIYWHYDSLFFYSLEMFNLQVQMPPFTSMGDTLTSILTIHELDGGNNTVYINADTLDQVLLCAYDPNDKSVTPQGIGSEGYILNDTELEYLVRFQNTGNDTAFTVMIRDQLDTNMDWSSLQPITSSHPMNVWVEPNGEVVFKFENIMLPDSNVNEIESHGFVKFRIQQKLGADIGTLFLNTAQIYFDYNPAIITNTVLNTIYDCDKLPLYLSTNIVCLGEELIGYSPEGNINDYTWNIDSFYNSSLDSLNWTADTVGNFNLQLISINQLCSKDTIISIAVLPDLSIQNTIDFVCQGDSILIYGVYQNSAGIYYDSLQTINGCDSLLFTTLTIDTLPSVSIADFSLDTVCLNSSLTVLPNATPSGGTYSGTGVVGSNFDPLLVGVGTHDVIYTFTDANSCVNSDTTIITVDACTGIDNVNSNYGILIYPNPSSGLFIIEKPSDLNKEVQIRVLDATSKLIVENTMPIGKQTIEVDITAYSSGVYYLQLQVGEEVIVKQILKN